MASASLDLPVGDTQGLAGFKRRRQELELLKLEEEIKSMTQCRILTLKTELEQLSDPRTGKLDEPTRLMFKDTLQSLLLNNQVAPAKDQKPLAKQAKVNPAQDTLTLKCFLSGLVYTDTVSQQFTARGLYTKYMEFYTVSGHPKDLMMTETAFCRQIKQVTGIFKKKCKMARFYTLNHAALRQHLLAMP